MKLILMVGVSGSGKSTIGKEFARLFNYEYISSDEMREKWYGTAEDQTHNYELFCRIEAMATTMLGEGKTVVIDATNLSRKTRKRFVKIGQTLDAELVAVVVQTSLETAKKRNATRERSVPDYAIERQFNNLRIPTEEEGFKTVFIVNNDAEKNQ